MLYDLGHMEYYRCPIRLELIRHVFPMLLGVAAMFLALGYAWARAVYS